MSETATVEDNGHRIEMEPFHSVLLDWGQRHYRIFPWRQRHTPYEVLMAEVMLHRTQAVQVARVYEPFLLQYPNIYTLSKADEGELAIALYPLGLHWRVPLLLQMATILTERFGGDVPEERSQLLALPGVSDYIASALRCFIWGHGDALVDTNTVRISGRLFGIEVNDSSRRNQRFRKLLAALVARHSPSQYHYALLDLAAQVCTKARPPACGVCPIARWCCYRSSTNQ